ncbi:MAG: hypothetical protein ACYC7D_15905 [Nitrososphaerales archaeon]
MIWENLRSTQRSLKLVLGVQVSYVTVFNWPARLVVTEYVIKRRYCKKCGKQILQPFQMWLMAETMKASVSA